MQFLGSTVSQDMSGWRDPWKTSSPTSCPRRLSSEARPGCSGLYPVKSPGMEMPQPHCAISGTDCPCGEKAFPYIQFEHLVYVMQFMPVVLHPTAIHHYKGAWFHLLSAAHRSWGAAVGSTLKPPGENRTSRTSREQAAEKAEQALALQPHQSP